jgi:hypothetical protein
VQPSPKQVCRIDDGVAVELPPHHRFKALTKSLLSGKSVAVQLAVHNAQGAHLFGGMV